MGRFLKPAFTAAPRIIGAYFAWMNKYSKHPEKYPLTVRYQRAIKLIDKVVKDLDVEVHVSGLENLPKNEKVCYVSNHLSSFDPVALLPLLKENTSVVAKKEIETFPFVAKVFLSMDGKFMDRSDLKQSLKVMMEVQKSLKNQDKSWLIYPEGTRNKDPLCNIREFHSGTFRAPTKAGVSIVPIATYGTQTVLKRKPRYKKHHVYISFLKPITPEDYSDMSTDVLAEKCRQVIQKEVTYKLRKEYNEIIKK